MLEKNEFRNYLQKELIRRCQANSRYSLRAFAKNLQIEPSFLSKILNGKKPITQKTFKKLSLSLGLNPDQIRKFNSESKNNNYSSLTMDQFQIIADWYHYAILELMKTRSFTPSKKWIAKVLNVSIHEISAAIERLINLEFIDENWNLLSASNSTVNNDFTNIALKKLQKGILEKSIDALENIPYELRDQSSMTMAIDPKLIPEAKEKIKNFRRELNKWFERYGNPTEVYHLSVSLYPVSNVNKSEEK